MDTFLTRAAMLLIVAMLVSRPGAACSVISIAKSEALVDQSTVIVVARALQYRQVPAANGSGGLVEFVMDETLKGSLPSNVLLLPGTLADSDDFNDGSVPYTFIRVGGRRGNCYATSYRHGGSFLLLLQPKRNSQNAPLDPSRPELTPFWAALSPTNEQVRGVDDPWVAWVRQRLTLGR